jgi:hypothetical protein
MPRHTADQTTRGKDRLKRLLVEGQTIYTLIDSVASNGRAECRVFIADANLNIIDITVSTAWAADLELIDLTSHSVIVLRGSGYSRTREIADYVGIALHGKDGDKTYRDEKL